MSLSGELLDAVYRNDTAAVQRAQVGNEMSNAILLDAVNRHDIGAVLYALQNGADVNCVREHDAYTHTTPLMEACKHGYGEIVRILLAAGADPWWRDSRDCAAIEHACQEGHLSVVELLINHDKEHLEIAGNRGLAPLFQAINYQRFEIVRLLLDRGANAHAATQDGRTALMRACYKGNLAIMRLLLAAGVDVEARDERQETAIHYAMGNERIEVMRELVLEHNANMFVVNRGGYTPFDLIVYRTDSSIVNQFLDIYSNKMAQDHGRLALHAILEAAEHAFVENKHFHSHLRMRLPLGTLTLHHFRILLSTLDTNLILTRDENGKLPIHLACRINAPVEFLSILVDIDTTTLQIADHAGALPLHECCCGVVDDSSVMFLVEQGGVGTLATRTHEGFLPLHVLCGSSNPSLRMVQFMVWSFPASVAARTNAGQYPFIIAACESSTASLSVVYELVRQYPGLIISN